VIWSGMAARSGAISPSWALLNDLRSLSSTAGHPGRDALGLVPDDPGPSGTFAP
jgi:hypothetical protein